MWHTLRLFSILSSAKRTKYYKNHNIFHSMGENCSIMDRHVPLYARLISLGDNVRIASDVHFITHDITHSMLNKIEKLMSIRGGKNILKKLAVLR